MESVFLKTYPIKEVSNQIGVAKGTFRQWGKALELDILSQSLSFKV